MGAIVIRMPASMLLPDKGFYTNRFYVKSETSDAKYVVAQHRTGRWWSCGCSGWIGHRHCKHLRELGLPGNHVPYEAALKAAA